MLAFVIFAVTFLVALLIAILLLYPSSKRVSTIPGLEPTSKEDGNLGDMKRAGSLHEFLVDLHDRFGPISRFWWGQTYVVSIACPHLFREHEQVFDRPPLLFRAFEPLLGASSIQYANGLDGRSRRKHYDRAFAAEKVAQSIACFQEQADSLAKKWAEKGESDHIPLSEDVIGYTLRSSLMSNFGIMNEPFIHKYRQAYDKLWSEMERRISDPHDISAASEKEFNEDLKVVQNIVKTIVEERRKQPEEQRSGLLIDMMMEFAEDNEDILLSDIGGYLVGSYHTTSNLLTWCLYHLAVNKDIQTKMYEEICEVVGDASKLELSTIKELRYTQQVIDETLRCSIIAPWAARFQDFDSELGGHKIPKNTPVIHALGVVAQDEALWPEPEEFDPDRFSEENKKDRTRLTFVPFGFAGQRICPAQKYSYAASTVLLATLIRRFKVSLCVEDEVAIPVYGLVTHPQEEIWVKVTKRH